MYLDRIFSCYIVLDDSGEGGPCTHHGIIRASTILRQRQTMAEALDDGSETTTAGRQNWPAPTSGEYTISNFAFDTGETLSSLRLHYQTLGTLQTFRDGQSSNAVLIMHGTGGSGSQFLNDQFAGELFNPGQPLDAQKFFLILRDGIGHGKSSKPSDAHHAKFPQYTYDDMVHADHRLLTEHLGVHHLRLVMGTSMGGMQSWVWGEKYPDFMDALMPLASLPVQISGRNRMWRRMAMEAIRSDPAWKGGEYRDEPPVSGLTTALDILTLMSSSPLQYQLQCPSRDAADEFLEQRIRSGLITTDANDLLFALNSSREYNPESKLSKIKVPLSAVNSADDQINPPELGILEHKVRTGLSNCRWKKAVVLPISKDTRGHGSHTWAVLWKHFLEELLHVSKLET
ncbi:hypothetical protein N0V93_006337 [Gnomoniopsis smithogilvyi]|uniref:AB hydrolase-1 domain-containing protein n=1 Tax=Gnomoniopsis smithogilvyi TaxID=1191159 RepID=A0A9W8YPF9_9PEZI|nr:hypothetical protein N0V93_006337 [Gnomoniopsis smithogilvyi]